MGGKRVFTHFMHKFIDNPGTVFTVQELAREFNFTQEQIRAAVNSNRRRHDFWENNLEVVTQGSAWRLRPDADVSPTTTTPIEIDDVLESTDEALTIGDVLEIIGFAGEDILVRVESTGQVYRLVAL